MLHRGVGSPDEDGKKQQKALSAERAFSMQYISN
jgi:hypothetical protein